MAGLKRRERPVGGGSGPRVSVTPGERKALYGALSRSLAYLRIGDRRRAQEAASDLDRRLHDKGL